MAIFRGMGGYLEDMILSQAQGAPRVDFATLTLGDNGLYYSGAYGWGTMEAPGIVVFRTDAGTVTAISQQQAPTIDYGAAEQAVIDAAAARDAGAWTPEILAAAQNPNVASAQVATANRVYLSGPDYVMTPQEFTLITAQPYNGEDLYAFTNGWKEALRQSIVSQNERTELTESLVMAATSAVIGGMVGAWAAATGAPAYGPVAAAQDLIGQTGIDLSWGANAIPDGFAPDPGFEQGVFDTSWEDAFATGWENAVAESANQNMALAEITGQVAPGTLAQTIGSDAASGYLQTAQEIIAAGNPVPSTSAPTWEDQAATGWENAVAESANQNMALAEITGQVPAGTLANTIGTDAANSYLQNAQQIISAGNPTLPPAGGGTSAGTSGGGTTVSDVIQTAGAAIPVITAGAGLIRQLTQSDGTSRSVPWATEGGQSVPGDSYYGEQPGTLMETLKKFPWWIVAVGAAFITN